MSLLLLLAGLSRAEDVVVTSNLTGAAIFLNGTDTGEVTPATLTGVKPGPVVVTVREGCASGSANVKVVAGQTAKVSLFAIEQGGTLQVKPNPPDATVSVDGKALKSPSQKVELECGEHVVRAERDGYAAATVTIEVTADEALVLPVELNRMELATLELSVQPRTALLLLDGKEVGTDTVTLPSVKPGEHVIRAEYTGYQSVEETVMLAAGDDVAWHFELVRTATKTRSSATQIRGPKRPTATTAEVEEEEAVPYYKRTTSADTSDEEEDEDDEEAEDEAARRAAAEAARRAAQAEAERVAAEAEEEEDEDLDEERPYYLDDEPASARSSTSKASSKSTSTSASDASKGGGSKTGLRVAGGVTAGLGAVGGVATVLLYNQADIAHDAWATKDAAAKESDDPELKQKARDYYNDVFVPKATSFYVAGAGTAALLGTGVILFVVDAPVMPVVVPGGGMLTWHLSF